MRKTYMEKSNIITIEDYEFSHEWHHLTDFLPCGSDSLVDDPYRGRSILLQGSKLEFVSFCLGVSGFNLQKYH